MWYGSTVSRDAGDRISRRSLLRVAGAGLAGGTLAVFGAGLLARTRRGPRVLAPPLGEEALQALVERTGVVDGPIPEYRKRASLVVMPRVSASVHAFSGRSEIIDNSATIEDIVVALPDDAWLLPPYCLWNQDPFTIVIHNGRLRCVLPSSPPHYSPAVNFDSLSGYLRFLLGDVEILRAPFPFEGGNLRFDEVDGLRFAFGDFSDVDEESVCRVFRVDRAIHLASDVALRGAALHLDEFLIFLGNHTAGIVSLSPHDGVTHDEPFRRLEQDLERARAILGDRLGYTIVDLQTSRADFAASCAFTNCLQFCERDGRHHIMAPDFGNLYEPQTLTRALDVYRNAGAVVHRVRIVTAAYSGGLHCLTNVLL